MGSIKPRQEDLFEAVAMALAHAEPATAPAAALAEIGPRFDADRAWLVRFDEAMTQWWVAYEWCADGVQAFLPDLPGVPISILARPLVDLRRGRPVVYADIEKIPDDAIALKEEMRREGNKATAGVPLFRDGRLVALVGVDDVRRVHRWTVEEMALLGRAGMLVLAAAERAERKSEDGGGASRAMAASPDGCYLRAGGCFVQVHWHEIIAISAEDDYTRVRLTGGQEFLEARPLSVWEAMLPADRFVRVHRSWIVGWSHMHRVSRESGGRWTMELRHSDLELPVSRRYQPKVSQRLNLRA